MISNYNYLDSYCYYLQDLNVITFYDEINQAGARLSGKTHADSEEWAKLCAVAMSNEKKIALYGFRKWNKDIGEMDKEVFNALDDLGIAHLCKITKPNNQRQYTFSNGSFIRIAGIHTQSTSKIALKGLASCSDYDLAISWREEANEFNKAEVQAIDFAIRGAKRYVKWSSCNPDVLYQDHIQYINARLPFDFEKMKRQHEQRKTIVENGLTKLFHYTNHKINPYLSESELSQLEELRVLDPEKAYCWYWGMPGAISESIFVRYVSIAKTTRDFTPSYFVGGIDIGQADSPTGHPSACSLFSVGYQGARIKAFKESEYYHSNATMQFKNSVELAKDMIAFYVDMAREFPLMRKGITVYVDYGSGGLTFIDRLVELANDRLLNWLSFEPVDKEIWLTKDRIDFTQISIIRGDLGYNWNRCPQTLRQYNLIQWKPQTGNSYELKMLDLNDDTWDSDMYALMQVARQIMQQSDNSHLLDKSSTFNKAQGLEGVYKQW